MLLYPEIILAPAMKILEQIANEKNYTASLITFKVANKNLRNMELENIYNTI